MLRMCTATPDDKWVDMTRCGRTCNEMQEEAHLYVGAANGEAEHLDAYKQQA